MKIAIVGKAGCGKTTVSKLFKAEGYSLYSVDDFVHRLYNNFNILIPDWFRFFQKNFKEVISEGHFNKSKLEEIILNNHFKRKILEDYIYNKIFKVIIKNSENIIVDGILPRFTKDFDIVLYAHVKDSVRHKRLLKRGMTKKRIKEIDNIQKDFYKELK